MSSVLVFLLGVSLIPLSLGLDNGLALTPPMGWLTWQRFRCQTDCANFPNECINEDLLKAQADRMAADGYLEAGYEYIIIDDCWSAKERDENDRLQADPDRFPSGIKALADYVHDKGLKFGIYGDYGLQTCAGYPGSLNYMELDAQTWADWGVDYLKFDTCGGFFDGMEEGHIKMAEALKATGRPIVLSCEVYVYKSDDTNMTRMTEACNLQRVASDIDDSLASLENNINRMVDKQDLFVPLQAPGYWNDPDMLIIGDFGLSYEQSKLQMAVWSLLASPLIMSNDLRTIKKEFADILLNKDAISINQDPLGVQGRQITDDDWVKTWIKPLKDNGAAIGIISYRTTGNIYRKIFKLSDFNLNNPDGYTVKNVFDPESLNGTTVIKPDDDIDARIPPTSAILYLVNEVKLTN